MLRLVAAGLVIIARETILKDYFDEKVEAERERKEKVKKEKQEQNQNKQEFHFHFGKDNP